VQLLVCVDISAAPISTHPAAVGSTRTPQSKEANVQQSTLCYGCLLNHVDTVLRLPKSQAVLTDNFSLHHHGVHCRELVVLHEFSCQSIYIRIWKSEDSTGNRKSSEIYI